MSETDFALHITSFLSRYLPGQRNLSTNTIVSYRDAFKLFLVFCQSGRKMKADRIRISDITPSNRHGGSDPQRAAASCRTRSRSG